MRKLVPFRLAVSLHTKLALALALTLTLVVGGFGYLLDSRDREHRAAELDARSARLTALVSRALSAAVWNVDVPGIESVVASLSTNAEVAAVNVMVDSIGMLAPGGPKTVDPATSFERTQPILYSLDSRAPQTIGLVRIVFTREPMMQAVRQNRTALLLMLVTLMISVSGVSYVLIRRIVRNPIQHLSKTMNSFASGSLDARCRVTSTDELGVLAAQFDAVADKLIESVARLRQSERSFRGIFENASDGIFQTDRCGTLHNVNPALALMLGYESPRALSMAEGWQDELLRPFELEQASNWPDHRDDRAFEVELTRRDGVRIWTLIRLRRASAVDSRASLLDGLVTDITERKHAARELLNRREELEQLVRERTLELTDAKETAEVASRAKSSFLTNMSHELRTPLNAVLGFSQLLMHEARERLLSQDLAQLHHIHAAGHHLLTLINDVLDVARIESGRVEVDICALDVESLMDEAVQMSGHLARQSGITLDADRGSAAPIGVLADAGRLRQVVINLLSNAIKYNRPGGKVLLKTSCDAERVVVEVSDTGLGMTREQLAHLYEPFNRLGRERGGIDGSGIGLALTRQLVRLMNGELDITSDPGRGTTARVSLPIAPAGFQSRPIGTASQPAASRSPIDSSAPAGVVLYIEDNPVNVILVEQMLARWDGIRFEHAPDGTSGVELARELRPDLVLLDMQLPDMSGDDVLELLREDDATRALPVVAVSASAMPDDVERARDAGVLDYWTKPLDLNQFLANVSRLLARAPAHGAASLDHARPSA